VLLRGASALAVPVHRFSGHWMEAASGTLSEQSLLRDFVSRLPVMEHFDVVGLKNDLAGGLYFKSNIPQGYGLGSSGALCAALYDRYCTQKTTDLSLLKSIFAQMESPLHGQSSGIDPLTCYIDKPLLIQNRTEVRLAESRHWPDGQRPVVWLIDSELPRQTGPLVTWFMERSAQPDFGAILAEQILPAHEAMLTAWLNADIVGFWDNIHTISQLQYKYMPPMIPANPALCRAWEKSFDLPDVALKICGAGGGGYVLGFARKKGDMEALLKDETLVATALD
jgi:mevalonate kinase